jgi:organic hydroperoxide reductase OsmC/OhrA
MPHPFPHRYQVSLDLTGADKNEIRADGKAVLFGGSPPQFDGTDPSRWSPEHLLLASLTQCLTLTFVALAKRPGIVPVSWHADAESVLEKTKEGLVFTSYLVKIKTSVPADKVDETKRLLTLIKKYCIVSNALKVPATVESEVSAA